MIKKSDMSLEQVIVARKRMMIAYFLGFAANWGSRVIKDFEDTAQSSPHWIILYYGLDILYVIGILVAAVYTLRYSSDLRNNQEYLQLVRSKRTHPGQYVAIAASLLLSILTCVVVRTISPTVSTKSLVDVALFVMCTTFCIALIALKNV